MSTDNEIVSYDPEIDIEAYYFSFPESGVQYIPSVEYSYMFKGESWGATWTGGPHGSRKDAMKAARMFIDCIVRKEDPDIQDEPSEG